MCSNGFYPTVVVVTVCYNSQDSIGKTIQNVADQDYPNLKHILIDGRSTDRTFEIILSYKNNLFKLISEPDSGIYDAMNKSIEFIDKDDWVIFLNAGDIFINNSVLIEIFSQVKPFHSLILGDTYVNMIGQQRKIKKCIPYKKFSIPACHQSMLFKGELLINDKYDINYKVGADFDLYLRIKKKLSNFQVKVFESAVSEIEPEGYSARNERVLSGDYFKIIKKNYGYIYSLVWLIYRKAKRFINVKK